MGWNLSTLKFSTETTCLRQELVIDLLGLDLKVEWPRSSGESIGTNESELFSCSNITGF